MDFTHLKGELVYLSSPYTHENVFVRNQRALEAARATAWIINNLRITVFGAIVHTEPLTPYHMPMQWEFWAEFDTVYISRSKEVWVLCIPGYTNSMGVTTECKIARDLGRKIVYMVPKHLQGIDNYEFTDADPGEEKLYGKIEPGRLGHPPFKATA